MSWEYLGGFTKSLAYSILKCPSACGSIMEVICAISLTMLHLSSASISVPSLGLFGAAKAYSIICPMWEMCALRTLQLLGTFF